MAYDNELILGFRYVDYKPVCGVSANLENNLLVPEDRLEAINTALGKAHENALKRAGFTKLSARPGRAYQAWQTPLGLREFAKFRLELFFDEGEMNETEDEAIVGVAVSGRYFPTFADWEDASGTLFPIVFDEKLNRLMSIAREEIESVLPEFNKAVWIVKLRHY